MDRSRLRVILAESRRRAGPGLAGDAHALLAAMQPLAASDGVADILADLRPHRGALRRALSGDLRAALRELAADRPLREACAALVAWVEGAPPAPAELSISLSTDSGTISGSPVSVVGHADNVAFAAPADPERARRRADLLGYLELTLRARNALDLSKIDPTDATYARPMELARVYIALNTTDAVKVEGDRQDEGRRPLGAVEAIGRMPGGRAMLLGAPGSGKSTFVSYLAHCLAAASLAALRKLPDAAKSLEQLPGWQQGALIPVPVILRDLAALPAVAAARRGSVGLIGDFLKAQAGELGCPNAAEPLIAALRAGKAALMLDGLDEVVGEAVLPRVAEAIADAAQAFPGPMLVTCRALDYQDERQRQLAGFQTFSLADLEPEQIDRFIAAWYAELADSGRRPAAQTAAEAGRMQGAVQSRDELRALAATPLLLTLMAQVHAFRGTLPDARARLYEECIDLLLLSWRQPRGGEPGLIGRLGLGSFGSNDLLTLMARLGFAAHSLAERDRSSSGPADLGESQVLEVLAERFADYDPDPVRCQTRAAVVLHALARGNGLLLKRGPKTYTFAHRTFQEFLAGYHLKSMRNAQAECLRRAAQPHWHEALLLMAGYQVLRESELERPIALAEKLLERGPLERCLAGELLALVGVERARGFDPALVAPGGLWSRAATALRELQSRGRAPAAPAALRHRAGLALGRLAYGELKDLSLAGAKPPFPDPRLPLALIGTPLQGHPGWRRTLEEHYWCPIEAGPFWFGDDRGGELQQIQIARPYKIARYPLTNAEYARFLAANGTAGYDPDRPWWTEHGRAYLLQGGYRYEGEPAQVIYPRSWTVPHYNGPLQPVVGVSWYEAAAYCRWLTAEGHSAGWLPPDQEIRLPTWPEWQRAARHTDQRRHPWGQEAPDSERANYSDTSLGAPSTVGCFPRGMAQCGAQDLLGNVREWTATPQELPEQTVPVKDFGSVGPDDKDRILISWNSWAQEVDDMCCGAHNWAGSDFRTAARSFRLVQAPCGEE